MKNITIILLITLSASLNSCADTSSDDVIKTVQVAEFEKLINDKVGVLVDVRSQGEYDAGNIEGSTLIPVNGGSFEEKIKVLDKKTPVLVYCKSGFRSMKASKILKEEGFELVYNLNGGFEAWSSAH